MVCRRGKSCRLRAALLGAIGVFNFFVLLPILNPQFVVLMPYGVSLFLKVLFGIAMGSSLNAAAAVRSSAVASRSVALSGA